MVKYLFCKHEELGLISQNSVKIGMVVEAGTDRPLRLTGQTLSKEVHRSWSSPPRLHAHIYTYTHLKLMKINFQNIRLVGDASELLECRSNMLEAPVSALVL